MPSDTHQLILRFVIARMALEGFSLTHWDGEHAKCLGGGKVPLPVPPSLGSHRPDAICYHSKNQIWGIGEAKTENDLTSPRTSTQIKQFSNVTMSNNQRPCHLFFGVPSSSVLIARKLLVKNGLQGKQNIHLLAIPDILVKEG